MFIQVWKTDPATKLHYMYNCQYVVHWSLHFLFQLPYNDQCKYFNSSGLDLVWEISHSNYLYYFNDRLKNIANILYYHFSLEWPAKVADTQQITDFEGKCLYPSLKNEAKTYVASCDQDVP